MSLRSVKALLLGAGSMFCANSQYMDYDYHASFERLATAYKEVESEACEAVMACAASVVDQAKGLNFENDLHYFLSENPGPFTPPTPFTFQPYEGDEVSTTVTCVCLCIASHPLLPLPRL